MTVFSGVRLQVGVSAWLSAENRIEVVFDGSAEHPNDRGTGMVTGTNTGQSILYFAAFEKGAK